VPIYKFFSIHISLSFREAHLILFSFSIKHIICKIGDYDIKKKSCKSIHVESFGEPTGFEGG